MWLVRLASVVATILCWTGLEARASVPTCAAIKSPAADTARAEGLKHYRQAKAKAETSEPEMTTALGFFEAACAAGDDGALELRAYALAGLGRFVEAAESLDAFLRAHPFDSLPDDIRARISSQQPMILANVASLTVTSPSDGLEVKVNHSVAGKTPLHDLRLAPGTYDVEVKVGATPISRQLSLAAGPHTEVFAPTAPISLPETASQPPDIWASRQRARSLPTGVIVSFAVGGTAVAGGVASLIWTLNRVATVNQSCTTQPVGNCGTILAERDASIAVTFATLGVGVVGLAVGGILLALEPKEATVPKSAPPTSTGLVCAPGLLSLACSGTF